MAVTCPGHDTGPAGPAGGPGRAGTWPRQATAMGSADYLTSPVRFAPLTALQRKGRNLGDFSPIAGH